MTAYEKMQTLKGRLFSDDLIKWNKLCSDGAPDEICDEFVDKMLLKYPQEKLSRFRVIDDTRDVSFKHNDLMEIYLHLLKITKDGSFNHLDQLDGLSIECVQDDIVVTASDVFNAFQDGELPGDLQFF